jgi:lia operon protein LiaG
MKRLIACIAAIPVGVVTPAAAQERYQLAGPRVAVYNLVGQVTVEPGPGSAVTVELTRGGASGRALSVERGPLDGRETLRVIYPSDDIRSATRAGGHETELRVRRDGTFGDSRDRGRRGWREGRQVRISDDGEFDGRADLRILVPQGQEIEVYLATGRLEATGVRGALWLDAASADVTASGIAGTLSVDVGSGNVDLRDVQGDVHVDTGSGDVDLSGVRGDVVTVNTGSGRVALATVTAGTLTIDTGSGDVDVTSATAPIIRLDTGSGAVRCELLANPELLEVDTGSGSVTLTLPPTYGAVVDLESGSGGIELDFPVQTRRMGHDRISGTIGDGRGTLRVETGSGRVRLLRSQNAQGG